MNARGPRSAAARWRALVPYAAPLLLVAVAALQIHLAHAHRLSPWKGGGFGMFATVDVAGLRYIRAYLLTQEGEVPIRVRRDGARIRGPARLASIAATMPTAARLDALADALLRDRQYADPESIDFSAVRVEVWRIAFDARERLVHGHKLAEVTRRRP